MRGRGVSKDGTGLIPTGLVPIGLGGLSQRPVARLAPRQVGAQRLGLARAALVPGLLAGLGQGRFVGAVGHPERESGTRLGRK